MAKNLEIEAKFLLNKSDFLKLINHFKIKEFFTQTNYYFDTEDFDLIKNHYAMRVRKLANDEYEATTKLPYKDGLMETNTIINKDDFTKLISGEIVYINEIEQSLNSVNFSQKDLHYYACLTTKRATTKYRDGELFFDESTYFDHTDYELEYEVNSNMDEAITTLLCLFNELDINSYSNSLPKIKRCIDYKQKHGL